jgi:hypothetical protein
MEIRGKVEFISALEHGADKSGKAYEKAYFIVNDGLGQYPNTYKIELFNKSDLLTGVGVGSDVVVSVNAKANEWQGKHYMSLSGYKVELLEQTQPIATAVSPAPTPPTESVPDLPF